MLTLIGLGLCDGTDITLRGKQAVATAARVYIESYTSLLQCSHEELERQLGCEITRLSRTDVEIGIDRILEEAKRVDVVVLVIGDVFGATTHTDLWLRARGMGVETRVVHNASIMNAVGAVGLELYRFGKTVSIPYWLPGFEPCSFLDGIRENRKLGLHTLCLLDIKADEGRFMSVREGIEHVRKAEAKLGLPSGDVVPEDLVIVGVARVGCPDQVIVAGTASQLAPLEFGAPPHALVVPGKLHHIEEEMLRAWAASTRGRATK